MEEAIAVKVTGLPEQTGIVEGEMLTGITLFTPFNTIGPTVTVHPLSSLIAAL